MNPDRIEFLPNPELDSLRICLEEEVQTILRDLTPPQFMHIFASQLFQSHLGSAFHAVNATEGTFWLADFETDVLVPIYNNGSHASKILEEIRHPLEKGLIGMVFATEQAFCENEIYRNTMHSKRIDRGLNLITASMIATPVFFGNKTRGVVSCVRLKADLDSPDPPGFSHKELRQIQVAADTLEVMIEHRTLQIALYGS